MRKRRIIIWFCLLIASGVMSGCGGALDSRGREMLLDSYDAYNRGDDKVASEYCDAFLHDYGKADRVAEAWFIRGLSRYRQDDIISAQKDMQAVITKTNHPILLGDAMFILAEIALANGDTIIAEQYYRDCIYNANIDSESTMRSHYRLGVLLQRRGLFRDGDIQFGHLMLRFLEHDLSKRAGHFVGAKAWAVQSGVFATASGADERVASLSKSGVISRRQARLSGKTLVYAVLVGRVSTYAQAEELLAEVKHLAPAPDAIIVIDRRSDSRF